MKVNLDGLADDGGIAGEAILPQAVSEHSLRNAGAFIGPRIDEGPAEDRPHAQNLKIVGCGEGP